VRSAAQDIKDAHKVNNNRLANILTQADNAIKIVLTYAICD